MFFFVFIKVNNIFAPNFIIDFFVNLLSKYAFSIVGLLVLIKIASINICLFEFIFFILFILIINLSFQLFLQASVFRLRFFIIIICICLRVQ